jgi:hypothetical protein
MFAGQRSRLAVLSVFGALLVFATPAAAQIAPPAPGCDRLVAFDPAQFGRPTVIDNKFLPLTPGTQLVLEGRANRTGALLPHTVTFTVTDLIKVIAGVPTRVMWDVDENEGEVVEAELAFFAQDDDGNVWNLGEYPEEYEDGFFLLAPNTWIAGLANAEAGIHMLDYKNEGYTYLQGYAPEIDFLDCAEVVAEDVRECGIPGAGSPPNDCYENGVLTHERSPLDPDGGIQTKYHAPEVGIAKVGAVDDPEGETLVLREIITLDQEQMAAVRQEALKLDQRGYRVSGVYCQTQPIAPNPPAECGAGQGAAPVPGGTAPAPGGSPPTPQGSSPTPKGSPAPSNPAATFPMPLKKGRSCYAKRSRPSARRISRRGARRVVIRRGSRVRVKKVPRRTCAELITRR